MKTTRLLALSALAAFPLVSHAADLGLSKNFNAFVFGGFQAASDSEGAVAVGGNFTGSQNNAMHVNGSQAPYGKLGGQNNIGLYVGSSFNAGVNGSASVTAYLNSKDGGYINNSATVIKTGGNATAFANMATDFATTKTALISQSAAIGTLATGANVTDLAGLDYSDQNHTKLNGVDLGTRNNLSFDVTKFAKKGTFDGVNVYVFNVTDAGLSALSTYNPIIQFSGLDATHTLLLNFTGTNVAWTPQIQTNSSNAYTLFNFQNATTASTSQQFTGSILAPKATLTQGSGNIQGNVIANEFIQGGELHFDAGSGTFKGWAPPAAVPEPGTWAVMGLGTLAALRRRKRK